MRVLVACEFSGTVRDAFAAQGHDAWSCDIVPSDTIGNHIEADVRGVLNYNWDLMIAHPPCTHLAVSGARWFHLKQQEQAEALDFVSTLLLAPINRIALENPVSIISSMIRKPDQIIQPWQFGHEATKKTCLWLKNLPNLEPTKIVSKGLMRTTKSGKTLPAWYSDLAKGPNRARARSMTFKGIAEAMALQWGVLCQQ